MNRIALAALVVALAAAVAVTVILAMRSVDAADAGVRTPPRPPAILGS